MRGIVHHVIVLRLEKEVPGLPRGHRHQPTSERRNRRVFEDHHIGKQETYRTDQVKRLIDPAVVIVSVIVPALGPQRFQKIMHSSRPLIRRHDGRTVSAVMSAPPSGRLTWLW